MQITYKNNRLERYIVAANLVNSAVIIATFVMLLGFPNPLVSRSILRLVQGVCFTLMVGEKSLRYYNSTDKRQFFRGYWQEIPLFLLLVIFILFSGKLYPDLERGIVISSAVSIYLVIQVVDKLCRTSVRLAATATNPTMTLILSFVVLIVGGAGFLYLPNAHNGPDMSLIDALFTATSATCVTGLTVKDTGSDFSSMGQWVILFLMQLGGLGIVIFGAVFSMLLGQAFTVRESVAMQDILNAGTVNKIGKMIAFIFTTTIIIETIGTILLMGNWGNYSYIGVNNHSPLFYSVFHAVSAFCNAGFSLYPDSFTGFKGNWQIYLVICPLIITGGLGFAVLYNIVQVLWNRFQLFTNRVLRRDSGPRTMAVKRFSLQTKIVVSASLVLIIVGMAGYILLNQYHTGTNDIDYSKGRNTLLLDAFFQSVTTRTAGFNTVDNGQLSDPSKLLSIALMCIGGSPGSTAGGIKTVTLVVIILACIAVMRKKDEAEIFNRSIRHTAIVRAITVLVLYSFTLLIIIFGLSITEQGSDTNFLDLSFEAASALGTVGLSTGLTPTLSSWGKLLLIFAMIIGRLGPMTLVASLAFNIKPSNYNYPTERVTIG